MKSIIMVVAHRDYSVPQTPPYLPVQVGKAESFHENWSRDNTGDQIAEKNETFCELTALYWGWKNLQADALGLCHYRRYPGSPRRKAGTVKERLLSTEEVEALLKQADVILPPKRHYWIETRESQYAHAHHAQDLKCVEQILRERYPAYLEAWRRMLQSRSGHICNLFVMRRELLNQYCDWLFDILFEAEKRLDISKYEPKDRRVFGYLGERLLDVWIEKNGLRTVEVPLVVTEKQHWLKKGFAFLQRKFSALFRDMS